MIASRPQPRFAFTHPAHFIAFGFGAGLAPFAPGTAGTLVAFPLWWVLGAYPPAVLFAILAFLFAVGVWACELTGRRMGVADHGAMCWDEIVAFLLVLAIAPQNWRWQAAAFLLFRAFDVVKPPPIRQLESRMKGGFGVMFDDLLAAGYTLLVLALARRFVFA
ncbi:MAG: phosphatidylglycerophosphatase A [Betaproteobacteria bacterium]|nr:phosphatidylglycerophosphatase A [Betaproteobacteria bacterium]MDH5221692.1 phosphatidylglycerophosphatase A [Betaproteobacteria bacterium]MDH5350847.1 phosphatidylglycerophosphatase A [Betaproteobacteria bacterium]